MNRDLLELLIHRLRHVSTDCIIGDGIATLLEAAYSQALNTSAEPVQKLAENEQVPSEATRERAIRIIAKTLWDWRNDGRDNEILQVEWQLLASDYMEQAGNVFDALLSAFPGMREGME